MNNINDIIQLRWPGWKIDGLIGEGSFGQVYRICREEMGRTMYRALKVLSIPANDAEIANLSYMNMDNETIAKYFENTARSIADESLVMESLKSAPNIVQVEEYALIKNEIGPGWTILIRMELLESLLQYHKRTGYPDI